MSDEENLSIIEFSEDVAEAEAPEPLPKGEYIATIKAAEGRVSTNTGNKYGAVTFFIPVEEFPADYPADMNPDGLSVVYRRVSLEDNPRSRFGLRRFCEAIGATAGRRIDMNEWVGLTAKVTVDHDTYEGVTREQIIRVESE